MSVENFKNSSLNAPRRRAADSTEMHSPTLNDVWGLLVEIRDRLDELEREQVIQSTAFPIDDLKKPDYAGHRRAHVEMIKAEILMDSYKSDATKQIIKMVVVFVVGLITSGFVSKLLDLSVLVK